MSATVSTSAPARVAVEAAGADVAAAFDACRRVARERARNFYYGLKLTPEPRRSAVYAIYAWMRLGDDIVDDGGARDARGAAFHRFRDLTESILAWRTAGGAGPGPQAGERDLMWTAFGETLRMFPVSDADVRAMLEGLEQDLGHAWCESEDELERYCSLVASSVGRVCVSIWGLRAGADRDEAMRLADRRGLAFQLTNILRDFAQDMDEGRRYLPRESFARFGVTPEGLRAWTPARECEAFVRRWAALARGHYEASAPLVDLVDPACAPTLWAMTTIYSGLLERIEADPACIVSGRRVRLASHRKAAIALRAAMMSRRERA